MKTYRFFRVIWRINALIIFGVGLIGAFVLILATWGIFKETNNTGHHSSIVDVGDGKNVAIKWSLGPFSRVEGTSYLMAPANSEQKYGQGYYSKNNSSTRNFLFFNTTDLTSHWLLPHHNYLFENTKRLGRHDDNSKYQEIKGLLYVVVKEDTNHDSRLTGKDGLCIAISDASGNNYREIMDKVDAYLGLKFEGNNRALVFFTKGNKNLVSEVDIERHLVVETRVLPGLP